MTNDDLAETCRRRLRDLDVGPRLLVAYSGGLDSSVLVDLLVDISPAGGPLPELIHVDHGLRSSSARDARHCRKTADRLGLPIRVVELDLDPDSTGQNDARRARMAAIAECAHRRGIDDVAFAHHGDDRIESFLINLRRGTGLDGLAPMAAADSFPIPGVDLRIVRPLIDCRRSQLERRAQNRPVDYVTDPTNETDAYERNRIRHHLVPELIDSPSRRTRIIETIDRLDDEQTAAEAHTDHLEDRASIFVPGLRNRAYRRQPLAEAPAATVARLFQRLAPSLDAGAIERIHRAIGKDRPEPRHLTLSGCVVTVVRNRVVFQPSHRRGGRDVLQQSAHPVKLRPFDKGRAPLFGADLRWGLVDGDLDDTDRSDSDRWTALFDVDKLSRPLNVRGFVRGARLKRTHGGGETDSYHQKLTKLFSAHRVDADCRWRWPCLYDDNDRLVWAAGLPRGAAAVVGPETTSRWRLTIGPPDDLTEIIQC